MNKLSIIFQLEKEIFYLFSALNSAGYDIENSPKGMHSLREIIRCEVENKTDKYSLLKKYFSRRHQGQFVQWVLHKKYNPRDLEYVYSKKDLDFFNKFDREFRKFISNEKKGLPWLKTKEVYLSEKKAREKKIIKELNGLTEKLNLDFNKIGLSKIIVVPNFLDAYGWGYGIKVNEIAFIIYGPLKNEDLRLISHEFFHIIINPVISKNKLFQREIKKYLKSDQVKKKFKTGGYPNWLVLIEEHLVRAFNIKTMDLDKKEKEKLLEQEKGKGYEYIEKIYSELKERYKKNELLDILDNILNNIDRLVL